MVDRAVDEQKAWRSFCTYVCGSARAKDFKRGLKAFTDRTRDNEATKLMEQWTKKESQELGKTAFSLYNVMTHSATHTKAAEGKDAIGTDLRMDRVRSVLGSRYWNKQVMLAAA